MSSDILNIKQAGVSSLLRNRLSNLGDTI